MLNKLQLIGFCGKEPEIKEFGNGNKVASFTIATSESWKDKKTGEKKTDTQWHNVSVFGPLVGVVEKYIKKGLKLYIEGKIKYESYEKDGQTKYITKIICNNLIMLDSKPASNNQNNVQNSAPVNEPQNIDTEDLPF